MTTETPLARVRGLGSAHEGAQHWWIERLTSVSTLLLFVWLLVSLLLPHGQAGWRHLIPGSLFFAVGAEALHLVTAYFIGPQAANKEGTYGALGVAAALLLGLFLLSRLAIASAVLNATLWRRRERRAGGVAP